MTLDLRGRQPQIFAYKLAFGLRTLPRFLCCAGQTLEQEVSCCAPVSAQTLHHSSVLALSVGVASFLPLGNLYGILLKHFGYILHFPF